MLGRWRSEPAGTSDAGPMTVAVGSGRTLDLHPVPPRLRQDVWDAAQARLRWLTVIESLPSGPLQDRLRELGDRIDAGVIEMHATAVRVGEVERVVTALEPERATAAYKDARRRAARDRTPPPEMEALETRFRSVQRLLNLIDDTEGKLRVIDARLTAAVAQAAEVAFTADADVLAGLGSDLDRLVEELDSLRHAMDTLG